MLASGTGNQNITAAAATARGVVRATPHVAEAALAQMRPLTGVTAATATVEGKGQLPLPCRTNLTLSKSSRVP